MDNIVEHRIEIFGRLMDVLGTDTLQAPKMATVGDLRSWLMATFPILNAHTFMIAQKNSILQEDDLLMDVGDISLMPPFSGG